MKWIEIKKGVRQGCILSPDLFFMYSQKAIEDLEGFEGVKVGEVNVNNVRCADDTLLYS